MKLNIVTLFCFFYELVFAQLSFYPSYNLSNTPGTMSDYHSVYSEPGGSYYVVWVDDGKILFVRSTDLGQTWLEKQTLISSSNTCGSPVVKSDYNYVYVVCHQFAGDYEILFISSTDFGQTWGPLQGISGMDSGSRDAQLALSGSSIVVVWEQKTSPINNKSEINIVESSDRGFSWSSPLNLSSSQGLHSYGVQINNSGPKFYCSWLESSSLTESDIYFSRSSDNGSTWTIPVNITNNAGFQSEQYMTLNGNTELYIAYVDGITLSDIYLIKSTDGGEIWSVPINITSNPGKSDNPCISIFDDNIYFMWADNSHTAPLYDSSDIFFKWSSDFGLTWLDSLNLSENSSNSLRPRICYDLNGPLPAPWLDVTIFWYDYVAGNSEIFAKRGNHTLVTAEIIPDLVNSFSLEQNYPNPFNPTTNIQFRISNFEFVNLRVYDSLGNEVATLVNEEKPAGTYEVVFDANSHSGEVRNLTSGIYFYQLLAGDYFQTKKMVLIK
jgi:hypothetical protein